MYDESLFNRDSFLLEESHPLTISVMYDHPKGESKSVTKEITPDIIEYHNGKSFIHIEMWYGYELVINAISHDIVYCTLFIQTSETSWKKLETFALNKIQPRHGGTLTSPSGKEMIYVISIKEFGGLKRGVML